MLQRDPGDFEALLANAMAMEKLSMYTYKEVEDMYRSVQE